MGEAPAKGHRFRNAKRIVCDLDDDTFEQIAKRAEKSGQSFAATVRELLEFGLMDVEDA